MQWGLTMYRLPFLSFLCASVWILSPPALAGEQGENGASESARSGGTAAISAEQARGRAHPGDARAWTLAQLVVDAEWRERTLERLERGDN